MTNAIEQSKREMYKQLNLMKKNADVLALPPLEAMLGNFESAFEAYLEESRQDSEALHQTARKRFEDIQSLEAVNAELTERLSLMTTDRDSLRNRMQAYEAREAPASTSGQTSGENVSCATLDGKTAAILGAVVDVRQIVSDWAVYGYKAKKQMKKLAYAINNNPELHSAMLQFEKGDGYGTWFLNNTDCMHSFHPAFPGGEQCVFCGVGK
jgi:hypothetical protein